MRGDETVTPAVDRASFATIVAILLVSCGSLVVAPEAGEALLARLYAGIAERFGVLYLLSAVACIGFLGWLAFGRYGNVRLGDAGESPEFSTTSWMAMLFCAGVGAGLLYWCCTEWTHYYLAPPFGAEARSVAAVEWASTYGLFHWGFSAWAIYCLPAIAIAYPYYTRRARSLRFSTCCHHFLAGHEHGARARLLDFFFMVGLIGGAGSSLGFSTPMLAAGFGHLAGIERSFGLEAIVVLVCVALFAVSVWLGLARGIRRLSHVNLYLAFALLAFVLVAGPTGFLIETSVNSVGILLDNFARMSLWSEPFGDSGFVEDWTVFYWAWWIAYAPFVGLFVARISRGRTLRGLILGMLGLGTAGSWLFYMILGNYGLFLELSGVLDIPALLEASDGNAMIVAVFDQLPASGLVIAVFCVVGLIFSATTYDSAAYTLASTATLNLAPGDEPARWLRLFWALALGALPLTLMWIGGLRTAQTAVLIVSLPLLVIGVLMSVSLVRSLAQDAA